MRRKIATIVHGRFFAFDLVRELCRQGVDVTLYTNYPAWAAERFGVPPRVVRSFSAHGVAVRLLDRVGLSRRLEPAVHTSFGRWAARRLNGDADVLQCFSGVAEELFSSAHAADKLKILVRASAHIVTQRALLDAEEQRSGVRVSKPSRWMVDRELREYALADRIMVLSTFTRDSFVEQGIAASKIWMLPLGVEVSRFGAEASDAQARQQRIAGAGKLRVLTTGAFSLRKGALDYAQLVEQAHAAFDFRWVGPVAAEARPFSARLAGKAEFTGKVPQYDLKAHYDWADVYLFPTIEDGYPVVLSQAQAAGLPIIATPNSSAPDIVRDGHTGWIVPARSAAAMEERLHGCLKDRPGLARVARACCERGDFDDWSAVASRFSALLQ